MLGKLYQKDKGIDKDIDFNCPMYVQIYFCMRSGCIPSSNTYQSGLGFLAFTTSDSEVPCFGKRFTAQQCFFVSAVKLKTHSSKRWNSVLEELGIELLSYSSTLFVGTIEGSVFPELPIFFKDMLSP